MKYFILYVLLSLSVYFLASYEKNDKFESYLKNKSKIYSGAYNALYHEYKTIANLVFKTNINTQEVKNIFENAALGTQEEKDKVRKELYEHLKERYRLLKDVDIRQLHFHLPNNDSFLRFHRPEKYGDNLTDVRATVKYVNSSLQPVDSFEEGRIYNGYRFVFPILDANKHLGSVEVSFNTHIFNKELMLSYSVKSLFLIRKDIVDIKLFKNEKTNYLQHGIGEFYVENVILQDFNKGKNLELSKDMTTQTIDLLNSNIDNTKTFSVYDSNIDKVITIIKVENKLTKKVVGIFLIYSNPKYIHNKTKNFYMILSLVNILIIIVLFFIYKRSKYEVEIRSNNKNLKKSREEILVLNRDLEKKVQQQTQKLHKSLEVFSENVIASNSDLDGVITYASKAFCDISGYSQEELVGEPHSILRHKDMPSDIFKKMWDTIQSGAVWSGEIKNSKKNGDYYWVNATIIPEYDENNNIIQYTSIRVDITGQKAKEDFMANMSHELRTPLNSIIGFSSILNKKQTNNQDKELSHQIHSSATSLLELINDILDLAKIQDANFKIEPFEFNAYSEFVEVAQKFEGLIHKKALTYETTIDNSLKGIFYGDVGRINQIVLNLISNACKFTPEYGTVQFSGFYEDGILILSVSDTGIGMSQKVQDKIFKPFEQADGSTTRKYGGTGLGLSITQNLVELMKGKIELNSAEGEGTRFVVSIPLEKLNDDTNEKFIVDKENKDDTLSGHILIAEDNKTNQMLIRMLVEDFGLTCDMANDGQEAVKMYKPEKHQLILMDENMPNMSGTQAMQEIRKNYKEIGAIIALTANAMEGDRERFLKAGMDDYIAKPIDEDELYNTLVKFLG